MALEHISQAFFYNTMSAMHAKIKECILLGRMEWGGGGERERERATWFIRPVNQDGYNYLDERERRTALDDIVYGCLA